MKMTEPEIPSNCPNCYMDIFLFVKEYVESITKEGESINVVFADPYKSDMYIGIEYNTIVKKSHIREFCHLDPFFLDNTISRDCVKVVVDDIICRWRKEVVKE